MSGYIGKICECYQDDILNIEKGPDDLMNKTRLIFQRLRENRLKIKPLKTVLLTSKVKYLGMMCSKEGIQADKKDLEKVQKFPVPKDVKQLMSWNGLATYYSKFIPNFGTIMEPVRKLLREGEEYVWNEKCQESFDTIKWILTTPPILAYPDGNEYFELFSDSSLYALGAVPEQRGRLIGYAHRTLLPAERRYSTTERELLGLVWSCNYWRHLLSNASFKAYIDHKPLIGEIKKKNSPTRLMRFKIALSDFNFEIIYRKGKDHGNADAMSRIEEKKEILREKTWKIETGK